MKCPNCNHEFEPEELPRCEVMDCTNLAMYEGWYRVKDFAGLPTGVIQKRMVCETHKSLLIGDRIEE